MRKCLAGIIIVIVVLSGCNKTEADYTSSQTPAQRGEISIDKNPSDSPDNTISQSPNENSKDIHEVNDYSWIHDFYELDIIEPEFVEFVFMDDRVEWLNKGGDLFNQLSTGLINLNDLSDMQKFYIRTFLSQDAGLPWETVGPLGNNLYDGKLPLYEEASSELADQGNNTYKAENVHDFSLLTAWSEGADGQGIGQYVEIAFPPKFPQITHIMVYNGYQKSKEAYYNNSRVKKLKLYVNGNPIMDIDLEDKPEVQTFMIDPIRSEQEVNLVFRFEILDVYPGNLYQDALLSEINFSGFDMP